MTGHVARVVHLTDGWYRWRAVCSCGWWALPSGRAWAERAATEHVGSLLSVPEVTA